MESTAVYWKSLRTLIGIFLKSSFERSKAKQIHIVFLQIFVAYGNRELETSNSDRAMA